MYYLLKHFLIRDEKIAQVLSICYMLSGFMVGSTQWLLYVTAAAFLPLVIASLLKLLQAPTVRNALQVAICYTLMFTSVYAAFNIISTYCIAAFLLLWFWKFRNHKNLILFRLRYLIITAAVTAALCFPCLYFTLELLNYLERGNSIAADTSFFNSNYLHPGALSSMLFPFTSVKMGFANTEGTMLNTYTGLFVLALLPVSVWLSIKEKNRPAMLMIAVALVFLLISFGDFIPARNAINLLPGFSYFRNPAIFRSYFILSLILFIALVLQNRKLSDIISEKVFRYMLWLIAAVSLLVLLVNIKSLKNFSGLSMTGLVKNISLSQTLLISSVIQLVIVMALITRIRVKKWSAAKLIFAGDLVINTLVCTPFFSVSSYTLPEVNNILKSEKGFPVQKRNPDDVPVTYTDQKGNAWPNVNIFSKEVAVAESYNGPLVLKSTGKGAHRYDGLVVYSGGDTANHSINITLQRPNHIRAEVTAEKAGQITLIQNYYTGWKSYINDNETVIAERGIPGITINIPAGASVIDFRYRRIEVWLSALLVHFVIIVFGMIKLREVIRRKRIRSSSPS